ncbi:hypothetical protein K466DRAFT_602835 [Polyporus arcularius HHB13444]|uniref:Fungal-type protein kinase domain-containing protein n=1 Tax=Polyporus arcularius HHB13444 TaxID=1314778 RepID=A0A5C3P3M3_9APHY|nr:hypothetical protein K466DRAFT_602835 [Polyporus arcularius HHB13444]
MSYPPGLTSPSKASAAQLDSWAVGKSTETSALRADLKKDIAGRVYYDRSEVLDSLFVASSPNALSNDRSVIDRVVAAITTTCAGDITAVRRIVLNARGVGDDKGKKAYETEMYPHLANIFRTVETICANAGYTRPYFRQLVSSPSKTLKSDDPLLPESFPTKPDFPVAEVPPPSSGTITEVVDAAQWLRWRQCPAFLEVKVLPSDGPVPAQNYKTRAVRDALVQGADYARAILSSRPFQLHVFGIFVSGTNLCVGMFDRRGITLSPEVDMFSTSGIRNMVSIVLKLTWDMSPVDLGHDPTVSLLDGHTYYNETYPRFLVKMSNGRVTSDAWRTVGLPLWSSHSLFGRGTSVWRALRVNVDTAQILKVAWRSSGRESETAIYERIKSAFNDSIPRGIATTPSGGGDVYSSLGQPVSVFHLRRHPSLCPDTGPVTDAILHRVALNDFGKPIWRYRDSAQFLGAISTVVQANEKLRDVGVVHRDISGGNLLIKVNATYKPTYEVDTDGKRKLKDELIEETELDINEGFLTDFEFASFTTPPATVVSRAVPALSHGRIAGDARSQGQHSRFKEVTVFTPEKVAGDGMTGTAAFMATELLRAIREDKTITRTFAQDAESLGYVILYSLYKHAVEDSQVSNDLRAELSKEFTEFFSAVSIAGLLSKRAQRFSHGREADDSMPYLLAYIDNDTALAICAHATWTFLAHLNETKKPRNDRTAVSAMMAEEFPSPRGGMPFDEAYPLWIGMLRKAALALPGAQGSAT